MSMTGGREDMGPRYRVVVAGERKAMDRCWVEVPGSFLDVAGSEIGTDCALGGGIFRVGCGLLGGIRGNTHRLRRKGIG